MTPGVFEYHRPKSVAEALELLGRFGDDGKVLAGGHSLVPMMKLRLSEPDERGRPQKQRLPMDGLSVTIGKLLVNFQAKLFEDALARREANTLSVDTFDEFTEVFADGQSKFVWAHWDGTDETENAIKDATKATIRCLPLEGEGPDPETGVCIKTGAPSAQRVLFAKNY